MAFYSQNSGENQNGRNRKPAYSRKVTDNVQVAIWTSIDKAGRTRFSWGIGRVNPNDDTKPYKTFPPEDLLEATKGFAALARAFAGTEELDGDLRQRLAALAASMDKIEEYGKANGRDAEVNGLDGSRALNL